MHLTFPLKQYIEFLILKQNNNGLTYLNVLFSLKMTIIISVHFLSQNFVYSYSLEINFYLLCRLKKKVSPEKMKEIQIKIDKERKELNSRKNLEENERNKIAKSLEKRENDLRKAQ